MMTARAVQLLREKLNISQREFSERLGITITSVSRYENNREPNRQVLKKLAALAESSNLHDLGEFFQAKWKDVLKTRIENLPSAGTQRRVSLADLKFTSACARYIKDDLQKTLNRVRKEIPDSYDNYPWLIESLRNALHTLERQRDEVEVHINESWSLAREEEDRNLLLRPPSFEQPQRKKGTNKRAQGDRYA